ncbi:error-prone DNA polymerase, DnaE-like [Ruaniaceae bacterium KH17]|nr:error-prone DNA polymerase, DnaE-like [Ruaniaceae bacterium KH17]
MTESYAELHAHSAFSFLDGANQPSELVAEAVRLGLTGLGITDHNGLYGVVQLSEAARAAGLPTVIGAEVTLGGAPRTGGKAATRIDAYDPAGSHLVILSRGPEGYHRLSRALALAHLATGKKDAIDIRLEELAEQSRGEWLVLTGCRKGTVRRALADGGEPAARAALAELVGAFGQENVAVEITARGAPEDSEIHAALAGLAEEFDLPLVATGGVHCARPSDQRLADVLAATRARADVEEIEGWLPAYPAHLRSAEQMLWLHRAHPHAVGNAARIAAELSFDLTLIAPRLPDFPVPEGHTESTWLTALTERGATERYGPRGAERMPGAWATIDRELAIINQLGFPGYFLIVHEIVEFCRSRNILCQGRGSAANSAVCFALGVTAVDAVRHKMLFERFLSLGRSGPPDIDLDIESGRREEVIQHVYERYGRHHAAQVANVISYRPRSAVRDAARALGYDTGQAEAWSKQIERWGQVPDDVGIPDRVVEIARPMLRLPRHLGIHSGGMVLCDRPVIEVCPVEWATMPGRTVLQWDKDDCADAGLVKFDLLGLGMLTALRYAFDELESRGVLHEGRPISIHNLPQEDPRVYELLCAAETVGVFQVESRAQMATLPRLRPQNFYDIVIEVALIRPGPIQGNSVNPFIRRKLGYEEETYLHPLLKPALERTRGVPLFQEQLMQIATDVAGFSPSEADALRKAMGSKRSLERMAALKGRLMEGMACKGISTEIGEQIYAKLQAFADFGFPESHAFSFAYLVYVSAWLKVHHPEIFFASLLASQPMGFYSPQSLVADARRHGVRILPADVTVSRVQPCVEDLPDGDHAPHTRRSTLVDASPGKAIRLGLAAIRSIGTKTAEQIVAVRERQPFTSLSDLTARVKLSRAQLEALASADALQAWGSRRQNLWAAGALSEEFGIVRGQWIQPPLPGTAFGAEAPELPQMDEVEEAVADVWATGVSPRSYPTEFVREGLVGVLTTEQARTAESGRRVKVAGVVTHRQRPATARGVTFLSLEDETGLVNVVCSAGVWARHRTLARTSAALIIRGVVESKDGVMNLVADGMEELSLRVPSRSRDFR